MATVFITGIGSGLGEALAHRHLAQGDEVYAVGRHLPHVLAAQANLHFLTSDLCDIESIETQLAAFIDKRRFSVAWLNAGMLGEIKPLAQTPVAELETIMRLNVWANKSIIDLLCTHTNTRQIVAISSGAAVNGSKGWGGYAISKAALNMLLKVYAKECESTHFCTLAPGVIRTPMVEYILNDVDETIYPSAARLKNGPVQTPDEAARRLIDVLARLLEYPSGEFVDIRKIK